MRLTGLVAAPLLATATLAAAHMEAQHDSLAPRHVTRDASHVPDTELSLQKRTFGLLCSSSLLGWLCPSSTSTESSCSKCSEGSSEKHKSHKSKGHHRKHKVPRKDWDCDGSGEDGYDYDHEGNSCPEKYHGFKWFGKTHGWQPPKHWTPKRSWEEPEGFKWKCKWWAPPVEWQPKHHDSFHCAKWFASLGWHLWPLKSFECNGSGKDGWLHDYMGNACPSKYSKDGFRWFGKSHGWQPRKGWVPALSWKEPAGFKWNCKWWAPPAKWQPKHHESFHVAKWFASLGWHLWPLKSFKCNGSGKDGWLRDYKGHACPSKYPKDGFRWFGKSHGWQPIKGWKPCQTWEEPDDFTWTCKWWAPPVKWQPKHRESFHVAKWFASFGWHLWPLESFECDGSGKDGWLHDYNGSTCPAKYPHGWLWFGKEKGWGPYKGWKCTDLWRFPSDFNEYLFTWWCPPTSWKKPKGFTIPKHWRKLGWH